jgi:hypothetical protein
MSRSISVVSEYDPSVYDDGIVVQTRGKQANESRRREQQPGSQTLVRLAYFDAGASEFSFQRAYGGFDGLDIASARLGSDARSEPRVSKMVGLKPHATYARDVVASKQRRDRI